MQKDFDQTFSEAVGKKIRRKRISLGISISEVARETGLFRQSIYNIENGESRILMIKLFEVCRVLKMNPDDFKKLHGKVKLFWEMERLPLHIQRELRNALKKLSN